MRRKRFLSLALALAIALGVSSVPAMSADSFNDTLKLFPESYRSDLTSLHNSHPNWSFKRLTVGIDFKTAIEHEHNCKRQLCTVQNVTATDVKACPSTCANASYHAVGNSRCASYDYIAECMDPRNYLNDTDIFQFEYLTNKSYYTEANIQKILEAKSSFMATAKQANASYAKIILAAAKTYNVDALFIVSRITKEVGAAYPSSIATGTFTGYKGYYNFFNIGGTITGSAKYAKNKNWTTPYRAIMGGVQVLSKEYISGAKKDNSPWQYTSYLQKFQVHPYSMYQLYDHQYMQTVDACIDESSYTAVSYKQLGYIDKAHTFVIPVYNNMDEVNSSVSVSFNGLTRSAKIGYVNTNNLNLRASASTSANSLAKLPKETLVYVAKTSGAWYRITVINGSYKLKQGWVAGSYITMCFGANIALNGSLSLTPRSSSGVVKYSAVSTTGAGAVTFSGNKFTGKTLGTAVVKATDSKATSQFTYISFTVAKAATAATTKKGTVTADLNVRKTASSTGTILTVLPKNTSVTISGTSGNWYKISAKVSGKTVTGYVSKSYVKLSASSAVATPAVTAVTKQLAIVNTAKLNVRKTASSSADIITVLVKSNLVYVTGVAGDWYRISRTSGGKTITGYLLKQYVNLLKVGTVYDASMLNVRSAASTSASVLVRIPSGTKVSIYSTSGSWYRVIFTYSSKTYVGYVSKAYIKL